MQLKWNGRNLNNRNCLFIDPNVLIQSGTTDSLSNDEIGSRSSLNRDLYNDGPTNGGMLGGPGGGDYGGGGGGGASSGIGSSSSSDHHWEMNYHEASIFLEVKLILFCCTKMKIKWRFSLPINLRPFISVLCCLIFYKCYEFEIKLPNIFSIFIY